MGQAMKPCLETARRYVEALTGDPDTPMNVRLFHDNSTQHQLAAKRYGPIKDLWAEILAFQGQGYGAFVVVNEGGNTNAEIARVRAVFVDADGIPLPEAWHLQPDFIVQRDATHWHAYWLVTDLPVAEFRAVQQRLVAHYGTDPAVCNPSRVMRLPGTLHQKGAA
jgi:hypothetical protein